MPSMPTAAPSNTFYSSLRSKCAFLLFAALLCFVPAIMQGQQKSLVFFQAADPQMGMFSNDQGSQREIENLDQLVDEANHLKPDFVVICGDLTNSSKNGEELSAFRTAISKLKVPLHLVPGNHDVGNHPTAQQLELYRRRYGRDYYSFRSGSFIGIVLNSMLMGQSPSIEDSNRQLAWLKRELSRDSRQKNVQIAVFQHIPFFVDSPNEPDSYWNVPSAERAEYLGLLHKYGVTHVFAGHLHRPVDAHDGQLELLIAGATGKPLGKSVSGFDVVRVTADDHWQHHYFPLTAMPADLNSTL